MKMSLIVCAVLCIFDLCATMYGYANNLIEEANPILRFFIEYSLVMFAVVKIVLTAVSFYILYVSYYHYHAFYVKYIMHGITFIYFLVGVYHIVGLNA